MGEGRRARRGEVAAQKNPHPPNATELAPSSLDSAPAIKAPLAAAFGIWQLHSVHGSCAIWSPSGWIIGGTGKHERVCG